MTNFKLSFSSLLLYDTKLKKMAQLRLMQATEALISTRIGHCSFLFRPLCNLSFSTLQTKSSDENDIFSEFSQNVRFDI